MRATKNARSNDARQNCVRIGVVSLMLCSWTLGAQDLASQQAALKVIRETAADICTTAPIQGSQRNLQLTGNAKAKLAGAVGKVVDLGVEGAAKYQSGRYEGVLQQELAAAIKSGNDCKLTVFNTLVQKMLTGPAVPDQGARAQASSVSEPRPTILYTYSSVTANGVVCNNGRIEKRASGGWVELIPGDPGCHRQPMGYMELGEDQAWFYIYDAGRNMTARIPKANGNVNWLRDKVYPHEATSKQWNVSQPVTRIN